MKSVPPLAFMNVSCVLIADCPSLSPTKSARDVSTILFCGVIEYPA